MYQLGRPEDFESEAEKNLTGDCESSRSSHANASDLFDKAGFAYKLEKSWDRAGDTYVKLANCHMLMVTQAYVDAALCHDGDNIYVMATHWHKETNNKEMMDQLALGEDFEKEEESNQWLGIKPLQVQQRGNRAEENCIKLAKCHLQMVAQSYVEAAHCYKETNIHVGAACIDKETSTKEAISCLEQAIRLFDSIGKHKMVARYCKEIAKLYEEKASFERRRNPLRGKRAANLHQNDEQSIEQSSAFYERAAELYENEDATYFYECKVKVAQFSGKLKQYSKAIEIFEDVAKLSLNSNSLKCQAKKHFLNAGICHLLESGIAAMTNALERYQELDPTFSGTSDYRFLVDIAAALGKKDVAKLHNTSREHNSILPPDPLTGDLLERLKLRMVGLSEDSAGARKFFAVVKRVSLIERPRLVK